VRPGLPLLVLLALLAGAGAAVMLEWLPALAAWLVLAVLVLAAAVDALRLWRQPAPEVGRSLPEVMAVGSWCQVELELETHQPLRVDVFDLHPSGWACEGLPQSLHLGAASRSTIRYRLRPHARGDFQFDGVHLRGYSPWRLWTRLRSVARGQAVRVYPDFAPLTRLALLSTEQASMLVGAHLRRRRGEGTEFEQMREYRTGDSMRQIDWKATARSRKLISREYQDERNQQLLLVVDTGRRMLASEGGLSHFDHALNAGLVVSWLALRQGDAVGMMTTGAPARWVAPARGPGALQGLLRGSYDLQPQPVATDYLAMAAGLGARQRRRALVMVLTNVRDEDSDELLAAVSLLKRRHLVCVASLREGELDQALASPVLDLGDAIGAGAVAGYLGQREAAHQALRTQRVMTLDVTAQELPAALVERYLAVKRDGLL
jgi:uncharacterized protein (DUF58 family)